LTIHDVLPATTAQIIKFHNKLSGRGILVLPFFVTNKEYVVNMKKGGAITTRNKLYIAAKATEMMEWSC
jgi:hypothetical protein